MNREQRKWLLCCIAVNLLLLAVVFGYFASISFPASEAIRVRNALLLDIAAPQDIEWKPITVPSSFRLERLAPSERFRSIISKLDVERMPSDWYKALALAGHLTMNAKDRGAIQANLNKTYDEITREGKGYCADFTEVYLGLAHAAGIFAREWAFSFNGFGGNGHAFIEIYDMQRGHWVWLDVYNNVHAIDTESGEPISAMEFRSYVLGERANVRIQSNGPGRLGYKYPEKLIEYYRRGTSEWYLWAGNAVFTYEANTLVFLGSLVTPALEQLIAIIAGVHPRMVVLVNETNRASIERMMQLRRTVLIGVCSGAALGIILLGQLWILFLSGPRKSETPA